MNLLTLRMRGRRPATVCRRFRPALEVLEARLVPSTSFYSADGTGNNVANPTLGSAGTDLLRASPAAYADGISTPSLANDPSARVVSDLLNNQADPSAPARDLTTLDQQSLSDFGYAWGQFLDHDMSLTPTNASDTLTITADPNDPSQMGDQTFDRSVTDPSTGTSTANPRQQTTAVTAFLDLSQVYSSSTAIADALRTGVGGQLKTSPGNMLPYDNSTYFTPAQLAVINMANDAGAVPTQDLFVTGDVRGNENVELTALQTLFVRNHNRLAAELQQEHPTWTDEQLYQEARKLNIAQYQQITYNNYLPDLLGANALSTYTGYNANVNPGIATEFSTVAFRFGHSLLSGGIERQGNNGLDVLPNDLAGAGIDLATDFFDPNVLSATTVIDPLTGHTSTNIDAILKGDADGVAQADDLLAINEVRDLLFANGGLTDNGQDLIARDVERARDDGIGSYNQVREAYGLPAVTSFAQITSNVQVQQELQQVYGTVDNIDPFEGGMAEDHAAGSDLGPLFTRIIADQFMRLRDGDRFFYLNESYNQDELNLIQQGNTLAKVIEANTGITNLQSDVFRFQASIGGTVLGNGSGSAGVAGITVQLQDASGDVLATTQTDGQGHYRFNQFSGPAADPTVDSGVSATGDYRVALLLPAGLTQTSINPATILISRGGVNVTGVNFNVAAKATQLFLVPSATTTAGVPATVTVIALDASNLIAPGYTGTVTLTSSGSGDTLPASYTFQASDHGIHTFTLTPAHAGSDTITATDSADALTANGTLNVTAAPVATQFFLVAAPTATAGMPMTVTVIPLDATSHMVLNYTGTVTFTSTGPGDTLPAAYTFQASDHGFHTFTLTAATAGIDTITATDSANALSAKVTLNVTAVPVATQFFLVPLTRASAGSPTSVAVIALDATNHIVPNYAGTVTLASSGSGDTLPASYTFQASDHGIHTFTLTPAAAGVDTVTATDSANAIAGKVSLSVLAARGATQFFLVPLSPANIGVPTSVAVIALDATGHLVTDYTGTVTLTSSDTGATLPASYTFQAGDRGMHTFALTFAQTGTQTVTATDAADGLTGSCTEQVGMGPPPV